LWHVWGTGEAFRGVLRGNLKERDHLEDLGVDRRVILKWAFKGWDVGHEVDWSG
jgi:hypothetical protein